MESKKLDSTEKLESEISKIYCGLVLITFEDFKKIILEKYYMISEKLRKNTKYRDPKLLIPIIIYIYFHCKGWKINKSQLLSVSQISSADFNDFLVQFCNYRSRMMKRQRLRSE